MLRVHFWGTRGSVPLSGSGSCRYGGCTPCVEVSPCRTDAGPDPESVTERLILDAGTGLFPLEESCSRSGSAEETVHILLSHYHCDHVAGIRFFAPLYAKGNRVLFYGASEEGVRQAVEGLFQAPYFPVPLGALPATVSFHQAGTAGMDLAGMRVRTAPQVHPGGALSFRIQSGACSVVYSTDHEIGAREDADAALVELARGADLWILGAPQTDEEHRRRGGWGHGSHTDAVQLAVRADVQTVALFHHDPHHDDDTLDRMEREAAEVAIGTGTKVLMARDGMELRLP